MSVNKKNNKKNKKLKKIKKIRIRVRKALKKHIFLEIWKEIKVVIIMKILKLNNFKKMIRKIKRDSKILSMIKFNQIKDKRNIDQF
jgi:hypothetical protein